ncbi:MAG: hypothetical protein LBM60_06365 [Clostridium sp.]|nr:hypothetical protein [Clostridium sp.]
MIHVILKLGLFGSLFLGFALFVFWMRKESILRSVYLRTSKSVDEAARRRALTNRRNLFRTQRKKGFLYRLEQKLIFSGLVRRFSFLTAEGWLLMNLSIATALYLGTVLLIGNLLMGIGIWFAWWILMEIIMAYSIARNDRIVLSNLMKFLDFLGNYSITAGEISGIFHQICRYFPQPIQSVLEECYVEAQTTGDIRTALLMMPEKIKHPQFHELVRNMEIAIRYCADFTVFVSNSKRAIREYQKARQEQKALANEAMINMFLLLGMSLMVFLCMESLVQISAYNILTSTIPGRIGVFIVLGIILLFIRKVRSLE